MPEEIIERVIDGVTYVTRRRWELRMCAYAMPELVSEETYIKVTESEGKHENT